MGQPLSNNLPVDYSNYPHQGLGFCEGHKILTSTLTLPLSPYPFGIQTPAHH